VIKGTKFENRYWDKIKQRMDIKVDKLKVKFAEYNEEDDNQVPVAEYFIQLSADEFISFLNEHKEAYTEEKLKDSVSRMAKFPEKFNAFKKVFEMVSPKDNIIRSIVNYALNKNNAALNFLCEEGVDLGDQYNVSIFDLIGITDYERKPEISHKALSQLLDSFKYWMVESGENIDLPSQSELFFSNLNRLGYEDLKQKYLSIFKETK
jgi:hypothetical protein